MVACSRRNYDDHRMVSLLLEHGADPNQGILLPQLRALLKLQMNIPPVSSGTAPSTPKASSQENMEYRMLSRLQRPAQRGSLGRTSEGKSRKHLSTKERIAAIAASEDADRE
jgi:hypothetical protein